MEDLYTSIGCGVSILGIQNYVDVCLTVTVLKGHLDTLEVVLLFQYSNKKIFFRKIKSIFGLCNPSFQIIKKFFQLGHFLAKIILIWNSQFWYSTTKVILLYTLHAGVRLIWQGRCFLHLRSASYMLKGPKSRAQPNHSTQLVITWYTPLRCIHKIDVNSNSIMLT